MISKEVAVIGAGPAGLNAAIEAARLGAEVVLIDENLRLGGQLTKQIHKFFGSEQHGAGTRGIDIAEELIEEARSVGVDLRPRTVVWGLYDGKILALNDEERAYRLSAEAIIMATGASENAVAFPGWTLPGVMGAGAAQTIVNVYRVLPGERFLIVGAGNVGLIVGYQLMQAGATVVSVVEMLPSIGGYAVHASKIARYGVPIRTSHTVREVRGDGKVEEAVIVEVDATGQAVAGSEETLEVDTVCIAAGLTPLTELAWIAECEHMYIGELGGYVPVHSRSMETLVPGLYVCGDASGIEEATTAMEEGKIAGISAVETLGHLGRDKALELRSACWERLETLRTGPFGSHTAEAKGRLMMRAGKTVRQNLSSIGGL